MGYGWHRYVEIKNTAAGKLKLWYLSRSSIFSPSFQNVARKILVKWSKKVRKLESYEWRNKSGLAPHFTTSDVQHKVLNTKYYNRYAHPLAHKIKAKIDSFMIILQSVKKHKGTRFIWVRIALGIYNFGAAAVVTGHDDIIWQWAIISNIRHILGTRLWFWLQGWIEIFQVILHSVGLFILKLNESLQSCKKICQKGWIGLAIYQQLLWGSFKFKIDKCVNCVGRLFFTQSLWKLDSGIIFSRCIQISTMRRIQICTYLLFAHSVFEKGRDLVCKSSECPW